MFKFLLHPVKKFPRVFSVMIKTLDWLNEQGGDQTLEVGDSAALIAHVEKFHPITDEMREYVDEFLPIENMDLQVMRLLSGDEIIEVSDGVDETGFLMSLGYIAIGDFDGGVVLFNVNDASVHVLEIDSLDLSRVEFDEDSEEYFWDDEPLEDASDDFEMAFEESSTAFSSLNEFDEVCVGVLKGEIDSAELGI